jgi:hypothetical protein
VKWKKNQLSTPRPVVDNVSIASLEHEILIDLKNSHTSLEIEKIYLRDAQVWLKGNLQFHFFKGQFWKHQIVKLINWLLTIAITYNIKKTSRFTWEVHFTMKTNLPKLLDLLIFCIYSLNFSLEFFIIIFFVTNLLNIIKFLPPQIRKTLIFYQLKPNCTNVLNFFS